MIFARFFGRKPSAASRLYGAIVALARQEKFYTDMEVPDNLDGRFDMIVLNMYLVLDRLRGVSPKFRQDLTDILFADLDRSLREMGVGDLSVSKKIRPMAEAFTGRLLAYAAAQEQGELAMIEAVQRNIYAGATNPKANILVKWISDARATLAKNTDEALVGGELNLS